jgi:hypothetical protein
MPFLHSPYLVAFDLENLLEILENNSKLEQLKGKRCKRICKFVSSVKKIPLKYKNNQYSAVVFGKNSLKNIKSMT